MLHRFKHNFLEKGQYYLHAWIKPIYDSKVKYESNDGNFPMPPPEEINKMNQKRVTILYCSVIVDPNMLVSLRSIYPPQSKSTERTRGDTEWLMDYYIYKNTTKVIYHASH